MGDGLRNFRAQGICRPPTSRLWPPGGGYPSRCALILDHVDCDIGAAPIKPTLDNSTQAHHMRGMSEPNNVVSIADWKAKHQRNHSQAQRVPVYVPVRDPDGRWRLEQIGTTTLDAELDLIRIDPS